MGRVIAILCGVDAVRELRPGLRPGQESYAALVRFLTQQLVDMALVQEWLVETCLR